MKKGVMVMRFGHCFKTTLAALLVLSALSLAACQPTPEDDFIRSKGDGLLQQAIEAPADAAVLPDFPASLTKSLVIRENELYLSIDAKLKIPDVAQYPVVRVLPKCIEIEDVEAVLDYVSSRYYLGVPSLDGSTFEGLTRQEILNELTENQWKIDHMNEIYPDSQEAREEYITWLEGRNAQLTEAYPSAPTKPILIDLATTETTVSGLDAYIYSDDDIRKGKLFYSPESAEDDIRGSTFIIDAMADESLKPTDTPVFDSMDTLIAFADKLIRELYPEQQYAFNRAEEFEFIYGVTFMPIYEGVPYVRTTGYEGATEGGASYGEGLFSFYWPDDRICVYAYKGGNFLRAIERYSPTVAAEVLNENVQLLDFSIIERAFENYIASGYSWHDGEIIAQTIVIDDIGLGMKRVPMINGEGYMVIPAWYFAGHLICKYDPENCSYTDLDENDERVEDFDREGVVAVINAIDGTVLN